jgi:hypothetical protein
VLAFEPGDEAGKIQEGPDSTSRLAPQAECRWMNPSTFSFCMMSSSSGNSLDFRANGNSLDSRANVALGWI